MSLLDDSAGKIRNVILVIVAAVAILAVILASGCGDDTEESDAADVITTPTPPVQTTCDTSAPSIIPEPSGRPQHVYFYRDTWPACQEQKPIVDELESTYQGQIEFIRVDLMTVEGDCEFERQQEAGVVTSSRIPSMVYIDADGKVVETTTGVQQMEILEEKLISLAGSG